MNYRNIRMELNAIIDDLKAGKINLEDSINQALTEFETSEEFYNAKRGLDWLNRNYKSLVKEYDILKSKRDNIRIDTDELSRYVDIKLNSNNSWDELHRKINKSLADQQANIDSTTSMLKELEEAVSFIKNILTIKSGFALKEDINWKEIDPLVKRLKNGKYNNRTGLIIKIVDRTSLLLGHNMTSYVIFTLANKYSIFEDLV